MIYRISNPNTETNNWYKSVSYYDYKGRVIQSFSQNHLAGIDRTDFQYRFNNEVLKTRVAHFKRNTHYMQGEKGVLKKLGELGGKININEIYKNLLKINTGIAENTSNPISFYNLVKTKGEWDLKANKKTIYGIGNDGKTQFIFGRQSMESQDIGNHHFGVVAKGFGFPEEFTLRQAGQYQIKPGTSRSEWQKTETVVTGANYSGPIYSKVLLPPYGDDPRDQKNIVNGFNYYNEHKDEKK